MAYDELLADRIKYAFKEKNVAFEIKKMMGGLCFLVDDKMCVGTHIDKKRGMPLLMCRIGEDKMQQVIGQRGSLPMDFTGRPMKGYVFVTPEGTDLEEDLEYWIQLALDFNPLAKSSKKKK